MAPPLDSGTEPTRAIAYAADTIRVKAAAPGWIATPLTQSLREDAARSQAILERTPMRRLGLPEDVAGAVLSPCSPAAAFITGTILPVGTAVTSRLDVELR